MSSSANAPSIAIVGGGPSGLVLLLTLRRRGIAATLYEREESPTARLRLGGTLDLGWDSGQRALRENGLQEIFDKHSRPEGDEYRLTDSDANVLMLRESDPNKDRTEIRPEIDRSALRQILLDAIPADSIKWGYALKSARTLEGGQHELTFSNGVTVVSDIVVGADGARSRIRPLVSPAVPTYAGVNGAEVSLSADTVVRPEVDDIRKLVGNGTLFAVKATKSLSAQKNTSGRIRTYVWFRGPEDWHLPDDPKEAKKVLLELYTGWNPTLLKLIQYADEDAIYPRPLYILPVDHKWDHVPGVTIIGDAAHLMIPAGAGANVAMLDGLELGLVLSEAISKGQTVDEREAAIEVWEKKSCAMAESMASMSFYGLEAGLHPDAPESLLNNDFDFNADDRDEAKHGFSA